MKKIITLLFVGLLFSSISNGQVILLQESFETDGLGSRYTSANVFASGTGCSDYFVRSQNGGAQCITNVIGNVDGTFFWAGEDTDDAGNPSPPVGTLTLNSVSISGYSNIEVKALLAIGRATGDRFETDDELLFQYNIDGSGWNTCGAFYGVAAPFNSDLTEDTDLDGVGDGTALSQTLTEYTFNVPTTGANIEVRFVMGQNGGTEEVIVDNIRIEGTIACNDPDIPTITATPSTVCPGANSTLSWTGNLNDATNWHIYTGSCGGTQIGSTATSSFVVSPAVTTTYYIRGEGGCVTPGACGQVTVTVQDITNPTITCPGNQVGSVNGSCVFSLPDYTSLATASDNCTASPTVTQSPAPGTNVGIGTTNIVLTATDGASNTANCNFNVVVSDNTNPTISCPGNQVGSVGASCTFSLPDYTSLATPADNCPGVVVTQVPAPGTNVGVGTTNIVLTATDGTSNTANCNFNVVVSDNTNPTISCPGNQVGSVGASCTFSLPDYTSLATPADNCPGVVVTQVPAPGTNVGPGTTNIVLTATDGNSNTANCNFDVVVSDNTNPTITCPGNQVGSVGAACTFSLPDYTALATPADNCPGVVVTQVPAPGTNVGPGTTNIVLTATDGNSNTANCNFDVVVSDNTNPTITCPGNQVGSVDASCNFTLPDYTALATPADNCPGVVVTQVPAPGTNVGPGTTNIVLTATDGNSNTANCNFDVVVSDNTNPTITCPGNQVGSVDASCNFSLPDYTSLATPADNCPGVVVTQVPAPGTNIGVGTTNIVLTATDGNSNTANCNFDVVVSDNTNPTITCPGNQTENPNASCQFTLPDYTGLVTTADNCTASPTVTQSPVAGTIISGTTTITMTATDGSSNTAQCTFDVVLNDAMAPTAVCQNINVTLDGAGNATIVAADIDGGSTDNCAGLTLSASQTSFTCADLGANNVTLTVTDGNSNTDNCVAVVTVIDNTNPTVTCPGNQTENPNVSCQFTLPDYTGLVTGSDNCGTPTISQSPVPGTVISGNTTITMTATDGSSNTSQCTFDVVLNDATAPTAVCQNINVYLDGAGNATIVAADIDGGSTDNCSGVTLSASQTAFTCADLGTNNVTLTATDGNSNTDNCVAVVTVMDTTSPTISCPANMVVCAGDVVTFTTPTGADNCSQTVTQTDGSGLTSGMVFPVGITTIEFTSTDGSGNTAICTFDVDVTSIDVTVNNASPVLTANQTGATYQWLDCDNGNAIIPSETGQAYTASTNGNYAVEITVGSCVDTSACENVSITGIEKNASSEGVHIYPNPTKGQFTISLNKVNANASVVVYSIVGNEIISQKLTNNSTPIDLTEYDKGVYFVSMQNGDHRIIKRIVKQ